ncbi:MULTISPECIES: Zn(2+)-responsive transcriptional regulator [Vibrio]|jgi:MerR family Zn(II)-responsive transcriptional regulator of zntA|uniref:HTH-type transcriptional regulator ZntR n=1 Tax=Vibrio celticus TaxID=446372 RepID=A0A1C3JC92_9VIBR|nr:Zn(2+)-responsive transcriptional regulator [Vibrio celticus]MDR9829422.1 Zn(2+)-responsive transcriptional regulator [Vibrio sp. FNV 38]SBT12727.1 HTH-type transcriptional regulator ZntR [Vibrio celticus]
MYRIGELANLHRIKVDTLRFYEKVEILQPSARSNAGYRLYNQHDEQKLAFVIRAKQVGFSLQDIKQLLSIEVDRDNRACSDSKAIVDSKLAQVDAQIQELQLFRVSLSTLSQSCCGTDEPATNCSILEALNSHD